MESYRFTVGFGYDRDEAVIFRDQVTKALKEAGWDPGQVKLNQIGATIGVHTGPYPIGVGIIRRHRIGEQSL